MLSCVLVIRISLSPFRAQEASRKRGQKECKCRWWERKWWTAGLRMWLSHNSQELWLLAQSQASWHFSTEWGRAHRLPLLAEELPTVNGYWEKESHFHFGEWSLVGCSSPCGRVASALHCWALISTYKVLKDVLRFIVLCFEILFTFICMGVLPACLYVPLKTRKENQISWTGVIQTVVNYYVGARNGA